MQRREYTLEEVRAALAFLDYDARDVWVRMALALKTSFGEDAFDIWDDWSQRSDRYNQRSARSVWKSAKAGGLTVGSLIHEAKAAGWAPEAATVPSAAELGERERRRQARAELLAREAAELEEYHQLIADHSAAIWQRLGPTGTSRYLGEKKVQAFGVGFAREAFLSVVHKDRVHAELIIDKGAQREFLERANSIPVDDRPFSFRHIKRGCIAVPLADAAGKLWSLQLIWPTGKKSFFYNARKSGCFHLIGEARADVPLVIAEGYATAASIHMATRYPVAVAIDAGNLQPVAQALRARYPERPMIIAADNDAGTEGNPGITMATAAARAIGAAVCWPEFEGRVAA